MKASDVVGVLDALEAEGISAWVDGGWGVDALVGQETREHADLDLAVDVADLSVVQSVMRTLGFEVDSRAEPGLPARLVMRDRRSRQVDIHPLAFDKEGNGWQQLSATGNAWGLYPAKDLESEGRIDDRKVRCLSPELQFRFRLGYEWTDKDKHDMRILGERLGALGLPPGL